MKTYIVSLEGTVLHFEDCILVTLSDDQVLALLDECSDSERAKIALEFEQINELVTLES